MVSSIVPRGGPAVVMGLTTAAAIGAIIYSHVAQVDERKAMREGVERDKERLRQERRMRRLQEQEASK
eukprot:Nitzschia sp. Nitz4//scaffold202_size38995//3001//3204//NITZ4_007625-RA/size38995-processed-gene-0.43-mRNA-1//-1//CDS//3329541363//695//frame0